MAYTNHLKVFKNYKAPEVNGIYLRLLCMTGERKGYSYILEGRRIVLGRSNDADIKLMDKEASREHAELSKYKDSYVLTDMGSQNGVKVKDKLIKQYLLKDADLFVIGSTVFRFNRLNISNDQNKNKTLGNLKQKTSKLDNTKDEVQKKSRKRILILLIIIFAGAMFMFDNPSSPKKRKHIKKNYNRNSKNSLLNSLKSQRKKTLNSEELDFKLEGTLQQGLREFREENYFRAVDFFNLALNLDPNNGRAEFYLNKTKQKIDDTILVMFNKGKREANQLKYAKAVGTYCFIIRYLQDYPEDARYKDAKSNIEYILEKLPQRKNEINCLPK